MRNHFPSRRETLLFRCLATFISGNPKVSFIYVQPDETLLQPLAHRKGFCLFPAHTHAPSSFHVPDLMQVSLASFALKLSSVQTPAPNSYVCLILKVLVRMCM